MKKYFCYDPEGGGMEFYDTPEEAKRAAEKALDEYRQEAQDGWDEDAAGSVCWGEVMEHSIVTNREPSEDPDFDETIDYGLVPA